MQVGNENYRIILLRTYLGQLWKNPVAKNYEKIRDYDRSIGKSNWNFIRLLVFEIFLLKVKFFNHLEICHFLFWWFSKNGRNFQTSKFARNFWKSGLTLQVSNENSGILVKDVFRAILAKPGNQESWKNLRMHRNYRSIEKNNPNLIP